MRDGTSKGSHPAPRNDAAKQHFAKLAELGIELETHERKKMKQYLLEKESEQEHSNDSENEKEKSLLADNQT
ncbi:hypothetical protein V9T40_003397 [Parthenolecanium corni]|uniref:Uncharacterized protein n=1 Tax=Parthenolecanium corni TaxID=536013 RepID=A0AAN9U2K8_9HEMI